MARSVKIMYLADTYGGPQAGTEGQLLQLVQYLDRSRYEPAITLLRGSDYTGRNPFHCPVRVLGINKLASVRSIFRFLRFARSLRREGYRIVHCFLNDVSLIGPPLLKLFGIHVVVSRRDMGFWHTPGNLAALRLVSPLVDRYVANSEAVKGVVRQREHVPEGNISVIYNGFVFRAENDTDVADGTKLMGIPDRCPVVGMVANLRPIKRINTLIEAFTLIAGHYPDAYLVIVGEDSPSPGGRSMMEELGELATRVGVREQVIFTGRIDDPASYIRRFTVAVLCSESEGFSNSIIEYMYAGRPVVCTDTGGNPEMVQDGHNGFLVPVGDSRALANRLLLLLSDNALANRLGKAARDTVLSSYSHTRMVSEHMSCYDEVFATRQSALSIKRTSGRMHR